MKKLLLVVMILLGFFISFCAGSYLEGGRIIASCNTPDVWTDIQGQRFVCMSLKDAQEQGA